MRLRFSTASMNSPNSIRTIGINDFDAIDQQCGSMAQHHVGNQHFYKVIDKKVEFYSSSTSFTHKKIVKQDFAIKF